MGVPAFAAERSLSKSASLSTIGELDGSLAAEVFPAASPDAALEARRAASVPLHAAPTCPAGERAVLVRTGGERVCEREASYWRWDLETMMYVSETRCVSWTFTPIEFQWQCQRYPRLIAVP